jgi:hypothetical protein
MAEEKVNFPNDLTEPMANIWPLEANTRFAHTSVDRLKKEHEKQRVLDLTDDGRNVEKPVGQNNTVKLPAIGNFDILTTLRRNEPNLIQISNQFVKNILNSSFIKQKTKSLILPPISESATVSNGNTVRKKGHAFPSPEHNLSSQGLDSPRVERIATDQIRRKRLQNHNECSQAQEPRQNNNEISCQDGQASHEPRAVSPGKHHQHTHKRIITGKPIRMFNPLTKRRSGSLSTPADDKTSSHQNEHNNKSNAKSLSKFKAISRLTMLYGRSQRITKSTHMASRLRLPSLGNVAHRKNLKNLGKGWNSFFRRYRIGEFREFIRVTKVGLLLYYFTRSRLLC